MIHLHGKVLMRRRHKTNHAQGFLCIKERQREREMIETYGIKTIML